MELVRIRLDETLLSDAANEEPIAAAAASVARLALREAP